MLKLLVTTFCIPGLLQAAVIGPEDVTTLTDSSSKASAELSRRCAQIGTLLGLDIHPGTRALCEKSAKEDFLSVEAVSECAARSDHDLYVCLKSIKGRRFSASVLSLCKNVRNGKGQYETDGCLEYFARSGSRFDMDLAGLCFKKNMQRFQHAENCLNAIRDRDLDAKKIMSKCQSKTGGMHPRGDNFENCLLEETRHAPTLSPDCRSTAVPTPAGGRR